MVNDFDDEKAKVIADAIIKAPHQRDLSVDDPMLATAQEAAATLDRLVDELKENGPPRIKSMIRLFWRLVGNNQARAAVGNVSTITFTVVRGRDQNIATVLVPLDWPARVKSDPLHSRLGLVFVASQLRDWFNGRILEPSVRTRAQAWEAEYLLWVQQNDAAFMPSTYQQEILAHYPSGLKGRINLDYEGYTYPSDARAR